MSSEQAATKADRPSAGRRQAPLDRPAAWADRAREAGRVLRQLVGVDDATLAAVPTDRARYTSLGALLVSTATIAAVSMWAGLRQVSDAGWALALALVVPALLWGVLVLSVDRALITSVSGSTWYRRLPTLLVRLAIAAVLGTVIAEPLVLQLFSSAIEQDIRTVRERQVDELRARLVRCNPLPGSAAVPPDCADSELNVGVALGGSAARLADLQAQDRQLDRQLTDERTEQGRLDEIARKEEAGASGDGLTGQRGCADLCARNKQVAADYARLHPPGPLIDRLAAVRDELTRLGRDVGARRDDFENARTQLIDQRVDRLRESQRGIGLLERMDALDRLTSDRGPLWIREWFLRATLILIDSMPVLVKFLGGVTEYDRAVDMCVGRNRAVHRARVTHDQNTTIETLRRQAEVGDAEADMQVRRRLNALQIEEQRLIDEERERYLRMAQT